MADAENLDNRSMMRTQRGSGLFLPLPVLVTLVLTAGAIVATYIFATKIELSSHSQAEGQRVTVVEEAVKYHGETLNKIDTRLEQIDMNLRTLMIKQGVVPQAKEK